jgi:hypothetical protein
MLPTAHNWQPSAPTLARSLLTTLASDLAAAARADTAGVGVEAWRETALDRLRQRYETKAHPHQDAFVWSDAKRIVIRAGRRGGKTVGMARRAVRRFLAGKRVLYAVPTQDQVDRFWSECKRVLAEDIDAGRIHKNETRHMLEVPGSENRIRAKTAWNADTLRGDYADDLILDEYQLMNEDAWGVVGAPMLLDTNGDAVFVYTPPSFRSAGNSKAHDPRHAAKLFAMAQADTTGRWADFHFASHDNPYISADALADIVADMSDLAYRQEVLAEDIDEVPGALWSRASLSASRLPVCPPLARVVIGVDPGTTADGDETGIIVGGRDRQPTPHGYIVADETTSGDPAIWPAAVIRAYIKHEADLIVAEKNNGGEMVAHVIRQTSVEIDGQTVNGANLPIKLVWASRGKQTRAEPIAVLWGTEGAPPRAHLVGHYGALEDELCQWLPGDASPNRLDALVWTMTELFPNAAKRQWSGSL